MPYDTILPLTGIDPKWANGSINCYNLVVRPAETNLMSITATVTGNVTVNYKKSLEAVRRSTKL